MSDSKAKMPQIGFLLGLCPHTPLGSLQHSPDPLAGFKGDLFLREGREGIVNYSIGVYRRTHCRSCDSIYEYCSEK